MLITANACLTNVAAENLKETDVTNRIFVRSFSRHLAVGKVMQTVLGVDPNDLVLTAESSKALAEEIQRLPVDEKSRLTLLYLLAFNIDGEKGHLIGENLGDDKAHVGEALARISDNEFKMACRYLGVSEDRVKVFRALVNAWRNENKQSKEQ
jgi:DNA-directed RNA polymerase specialized sigma24 family protein